MPGPIAQGTLTSGGVATAGNASDTMIVPTGMTQMRLTLTGLDGSNTVKTQKRTAPSGAFVDQTTYNSDQSNVGVAVAAGEEWRVIDITHQATKDIRYKLSCEN